MKKIIIITFLFVNTLFSEDLIINGETIYISGSHNYDNVIISNGGVLSLIEYDVMDKRS